MIKLYPRHVLTLALATMVVVFAFTGALFGAPVTMHPRLLMRPSDMPALRARMNPSAAGGVNGMSPHRWIEMERVVPNALRPNASEPAS